MSRKKNVFAGDADALKEYLAEYKDPYERFQVLVDLHAKIFGAYGMGFYGGSEEELKRKNNLLVRAILKNEPVPEEEMFGKKPY